MQGIIIKNISNQYFVKIGQETYHCTARGKFKKEEELTPVVGDKVKIEQLGEQEGIIQEVLRRTNYIKRPKLANITQLVFVLSTKMPKPDLLLLDKQLAFAEYLQMKPIIVINKVDLELVKVIKKRYEKIGYIVIETIAKQGQGIDTLRQYLQHQISAFSGNSGVGKSTLLNQLFQKNMTTEGDISQKNKKGKNTTTTICLYELEPDTYIADTPGFSTFDIQEIQAKELANYFVEFIPHRKDCTYTGCTHIKEEECGIRKAVQIGEISHERYQNYSKLYQELKDREEHKW